jgi:hypothetical protein
MICALITDLAITDADGGRVSMKNGAIELTTVK